MSEPAEVRLKRLRMRSMRRGIKEMDLILTDFSARRLAGLTSADLDLYEALLHENDQDIYGWILGTAEAPEQYARLMRDIIAGARGIVRAQ